MWIETKINVVNTNQEDLGLKKDPLEVECFIETDTIKAFHEVLKRNESDIVDPNWSYIYLDSGENFVIKVPFTELKSLLNVSRA